MKEAFIRIFGSATKLVFVIIAIALVFFTYKGIIEGKDFFTITAMVFTAYYSKNRSLEEK